MFSARSIGAFFLAALEALNIAATSSYVESPAYEVVDYLTNPYGIVDNSIEYVFGDDRIETDSEFLERSTIIIDKDVVTIDGVPYTNVWLSNEAAQQFRTEGFDLATAFNLTSHNQGTFVTAGGTITGVPVYQLEQGGNYFSPLIMANERGTIYSAGDWQFYYTIPSSTVPTTRSNYWRLFDEQFSVQNANNIPVDTPQAFSINTVGGSRIQAHYGPYDTTLQQYISGRLANLPNSYWDQTPVDFTWTTGEIPAEEVMPANTGLNIQIPTQTINNFYINYPEYDVPSANIPIVDVDPSLIDDLILPLIPIINTGDANIEYSEHETPTPPAPGTIANEPWESLRRALQNIQESIQQGTTIQQAIKAGQDIIAQLIAPINTTLQTINNSIGNLIDKIETGSIDFFRDTIRSIRVPFQRWFGILAQNLGIWHYVVEWLQYIAAPFSWFWNVFTNVNPILISPVYALFAATLVIAIYRRFGR